MGKIVQLMQQYGVKKHARKNIEFRNYIYPSR